VLGIGALAACRHVPEDEIREEPPDQPEAYVLDHFLCYQTVHTGHDVPGFRVFLKDQFDTQGRLFSTLQQVAFCNPATKTLLPSSQGEEEGEGQPEQTPIAHPDHHLTLFLGGEEVHDPPRPSVVVTNQFSPNGMRLQLGARVSLFLPTEKITPHPHPMPTDLDHFKCHEVRDAAAPGRTVDLKDELEVPYTNLTVGPVKLLCNPTAKDGYPGDPHVPGARVQHPESHLVCYELSRPVEASFTGRHQIGAVSVVATRLSMLCLPSTKQVEPPSPQS
jgi:hypothetical protein